MGEETNGRDYKNIGMMGKQEGKETTKEKEKIGQERKEIMNKEENWKELAVM
jgi:hypothetical protein